MKLQPRGLWLELTVGLAILASLITLWIRSLEVNDRATIAFSPKTFVQGTSANGSLGVAFARNLGGIDPYWIRTGIRSSTPNPEKERLTYGNFGFGTFSGHGLRLALPFWLPSVLVAIAIGWRMCSRENSFLKAAGRLHSRQPSNS